MCFVKFVKCVVCFQNGPVEDSVAEFSCEASVKAVTALGCTPIGDALQKSISVT